MSQYAQETAETFAQARACYEETEQWLASEAAALTHGELEDQLGTRGRELLRVLHQGHLDLRALREQRRDDVAGADGIARTRAEKGHSRPLATVFGQVTVTRMAYRAPGAPNVHPLDAELNLPEEKQSHGLRKLAAIESARGSFDEAAAALTRATGVKTGKRQVEELARRAAADIDAFYHERRPDPAPDDHVLVLTGDGKGIVMRPEALRPATAKAAAAGSRKLATRLSPGEKNGRKRMAELACVYDAAPVARTPDDIIAPPGKDKKERSRGPRAAGKWLTASVTDDIPAVIATAFGEAERRDPQHRRTWIALADGNNSQLGAIEAEAARHGVTITVTCDFVHVLEYCPPGRSSIKATPTPRPGSPSRPQRSSKAKPPRSRPASAAAPPPSATPQPNARARMTARTTSPPRNHIWITPPPSPKAGPSHRRHRGRMPPSRGRPHGHHRSQVGPGWSRGHTQAPRPHQQRRLQPVLALSPAARTQARPQRTLPQRLRPRRIISSLQKSRTLLEVAPSMFDAQDGLVFLADWMVNGALAEATAAQLGFEYECDAPFAGRKGRTRLAVVDGVVNEHVVRLLVSALPERERVVVCGTGIDTDARAVLRELRPGSTLRKIPAALLGAYRTSQQLSLESMQVSGTVEPKGAPVR